jgi:hypothetical protein
MTPHPHKRRTYSVLSIARRHPRLFLALVTHRKPKP